MGAMCLPSATLCLNYDCEWRKSAGTFKINISIFEEVISKVNWEIARKNMLIFNAIQWVATLSCLILTYARFFLIIFEAPTKSAKKGLHLTCLLFGQDTHTKCHQLPGRADMPTLRIRSGGQPRV